MRAVDEHGHVERPGRRHDRPHGEHATGGGDDVVDDDQLRPPGDDLGVGPGDLLGRLEREGHLHLHDPHAVALGEGPRGEAHGVVGRVGEHELVALPPVERVQHRGDARGGVRHEHEVLALRAQGRAERAPRMAEQLRRAAAEEFHRVALHLQLPMLLRLEHLARTGAERAVVEEREGRVQQEELAHPRSVGVQR